MRQARSSHYVLIITILAFIAAPFSSSCSTESQGPEQGGDHLPDLRTYANVSFPPSALTPDAIVTKEVLNPLLRRFVHIHTQVRICLSPSYATGEETLRLQSLLQFRDDSSRQYGLESVLDFLIERLGALTGSVDRFDKRAEINILQDSATASCDLVVDVKKSGFFPQSDTFAAEVFPPLFYPGQIINSSGERNHAAVAYLAEPHSDGSASLGLDGGQSKSIEAKLLSLQQIIAWYMGLPESQESSSPLSRKAMSPLHWPLVEETLQNRVNGESLSFAAFISLLEGIVGAEDLNNAQHYFDELRAPNPLDDPDLESVDSIRSQFPGFSFGSAVPRTRVYDDAAFTATLRWTEAVRVCVFDQSGLEINKDDLDALVAIFVPGSTAWEASLPSQNVLKAFQVMFPNRLRFQGGLNLSRSSCQLPVFIRSDSQFPFTQQIDAHPQTQDLDLRADLLRRRA